jgi:uncharacterized membrane protein
VEATCSSETSVEFQWTARLYIPEDKTLFFHTSYILKQPLSGMEIQQFSLKQFAENRYFCSLASYMKNKGCVIQAQ